MVKNSGTYKNQLSKHGNIVGVNKDFEQDFDLKFAERLPSLRLNLNSRGSTANYVIKNNH